MGYFGQLGAVAAGELQPLITTSSSFQSLARKQLIAMNDPRKFALASATYEATAPKVITFSGKADRDAAYNALLTDPGDTSWLAKFDKDAEGDWISSAVRKLVVTTITKRRTDWKAQVPWIVSVGVVLVAGVYLTRTRKRGAARRRPRARARRRR